MVPFVAENQQKERSQLRERLWEIIFEAETKAGRYFDIALLMLIGISVLVVSLETVESIDARYDRLIHQLEWGFTIIFSIEYLLRLWVVRRPLHYAKSFFGVVDLLSCLPMYVSLFFPASKSFLIIRVLRLLRIFRVLKMLRHVQGSQVLLRALYTSRAKITVFFFSVVTFAILAGASMYIVEGGENGFDDIPTSIYWAIVTISTVGFGDITPGTPLGKFITSFCILVGYAIIAVPTGIISAELTKQSGTEDTDACPSCGVHGHLEDAKYCRRCGEKI